MSTPFLPVHQARAGSIVPPALAGIAFPLFGLVFPHQLVEDAVEVVTVLNRQGKNVPQFLNTPGVNARQIGPGVWYRRSVFKQPDNGNLKRINERLETLGWRNDPFGLITGYHAPAYPGHAGKVSLGQPFAAALGHQVPREELGDWYVFFHKKSIEMA
jgi:hypothetical protein